MSARERAERHQNSLEKEVVFQLDRLDVFVKSADRVSKINQVVVVIKSLFDKIKLSNTKVAELTDESDKDAVNRWLEEVEARVSSGIDTANSYLQSAPAEEPTGSIRTKTSKSKKTGSSNRLEQLRLMSQLKEEERKAAAAIALEKSKHDIELAQVAEGHRQKIQSLRDEVELLNEESDSRASIHLDDEVRSRRSSRAAVASWLDNSSNHPQATVVDPSHPVVSTGQTSNVCSTSRPMPVVSSVQYSSSAPEMPISFLSNSNLSVSAPIVESNVVPVDNRVLTTVSSAVTENVPVVQFRLPSNEPNVHIDHSTHHAGLLSDIPSSTQKTNFSRSLPRWNLVEFDGNPLQWPEWKGMFTSTVIQSPINNDERMNHLKTLVTGRAKTAIAGLPYDGKWFAEAWAILERKFGRPHVIISAQLDKIQSYPPVKMHSSSAIIDYSVAVTNLVSVFTQLDYTSDLQSASNMQLLISKLPPNLREKWFSYITSNSLDRPTVLHFDKWLQQISDTHEHMLGYQSVPTKQFPDKQKDRTQKVGTFVANSRQTPSNTPSVPDSCISCRGRHKLKSCDDFIKKNQTERAEFLKINKLCFCCFGEKHSFRNCPNAKPCGVDGCKKTHHVLIHSAQIVYKKLDTIRTGIRCAPAASNKGFLQIIPIRIHGPNASETTFALCDLGSTHSWIDADFGRAIGLKEKSIQIVVNSIQDSNLIHTSLAQLQISGLNDNSKHEVSAYFKQPFHLGRETIDVQALKRKWPHLSEITSNKIRLEDVKMLLGQDVFPLIRPLEYRTTDSNQPWAVRLPLGWVLSGPVPSILREECPSQCFFSSTSEDTLLSDQVRHWWDMESYATTVKADTRSVDDRRAIQILDTTTTHNGKRYAMGLLWAKDDTKLPNNYKSAYSQLLSLERRLSKDPVLQSRYAETIRTDISKGYVRLVNKQELQDTRDENQWLLPHNPVVHPNKPGKVRRVCNAASKYMGTSLNDALITGPDLLNSLIGILLRFRQYPVAVTADIEAMFLQVEVTEKDQRAFRFLWRESPSEDVNVYQYTRHVFGSKDSPTCANYALQRTARDNFEEYKNAAQAILNDFYMDDFIKSLKTADEALELSIKLKDLLTKGGFNLTKWISNQTNLVASVCESKDHGILDEAHCMFVLGLKWNVAKDTLMIDRGLQRELSSNPTQRELLSFVSSVFDPLGILAPFTITARILLKETWQANGQKWDEPLTAEQKESFTIWVEDMKVIREIELPRLYMPEMDELELHIFGDASLDAICAVAYLRGVINKEVHVQFIIGKCRVAPAKQTTIPKLELQASLIASRLRCIVVEQLEFSFTRCVLWTDSSCVLQWINTSTKKHPIFVANRVAEILDQSTVDEWRHVPGEQNPADCGTRGLMPNQLIESQWFDGPRFLKDPEELWPKTTDDILGKSVDVVTVNVLTEVSPAFPWMKYSSFYKILRIVARIKSLLKPKALRGLQLSAEDVRNAQRAVLQLSQKESFSKELSTLSADDQILPSSPIRHLSPFPDASGVLRAKGRTRKSVSLTFSTKHPMILDSRHPVVKLFLLQFHSRCHHQGVEYLRSVINQEYWILHLRSSLRRIKQACVTCQKKSALTVQPEMSDLPRERLADRCYPFSRVGVDYFGPFEVRLGRKHFKRWVCLFTCMVTRAVHLEVCHTLSADSCIMALRRFIARRGRPEVIISDNGTNFVGANAELIQLTEQWNSVIVQEELTQNQIVWKFNPPAAPHFGGVWERLVRSCKQAMYAILGSTCLTDELLSTVLAQVEQILNSRPLVPASADVEDLEALTPNHFLLGRPSVNLPLCYHHPTDRPHYRKFFKNTEIYVDNIWTRWLKEYAPTLNKREKWHSSSRSVSVGDLVWILDPSSPRGLYPLARILSLHFGDDGVARSALIKTKTGLYTRPLVKVVPLNI